MDIWCFEQCRLIVKNDLYKLGDFGLANSFTNDKGKAGVTNIPPDIKEGDSRYMSKDLLDFRPKDLTKVRFIMLLSLDDYVAGHCFQGMTNYACTILAHILH